MPTRHTVVQGETLAKIAARHGFADGSKIYEHSDNAELREQRPNPDILRAGDVVVIPDVAPGGVEADVDTVHRFRVHRPRQRLVLNLQDHDGQALDGWLYVLHAGEETFEGTVDGPIEETLPASLEVARLEVRQSDDATARCIAWDLRIGHLDPLDTVTGAQARLNNLGFGAGAVDDDAGPRTEASVRDFQAAHDLEVDGAMSSEFLAKLEEVHGC